MFSKILHKLFTLIQEMKVLYFVQKINYHAKVINKMWRANTNKDKLHRLCHYDR